MNAYLVENRIELESNVNVCKDYMKAAKILVNVI